MTTKTCQGRKPLLAALLARALMLAGIATAPGLAHASELPDHASPSLCVVLIGLAGQAGVIASEDEQDYKDASETFREKSVELNGGKTESDQMIGSSVNPLMGLGKKDLARGAEMCLEAVDEDFDSDE